MNVLMIVNFSSIPFESGNSRFIYIINKLNLKKNKIEFITSSFRHGTKTKRKYTKKELSINKYKITLIDEPGYKKNVSIKRFLSHKKLSQNIYKYLNKLDYKPDIIYCSIPSIDVAYKSLQFAKKNNIRFILDIQDLWPEAFKMALNIPIISDIIFYPMMKKANYIYKNSNEIVAVSDTYVNRALRINKKGARGISVYLGTDLNYFDECKKKNIVKFKDDIIRVCYIGTLGTSYDIISIIDSIKKLNKKGINNIKFIIMGDGPKRKEFEQYAESSGIDYEFTGRLPYEKMIGIMSSCDIAVNPIVGSSVASIINKVGDYAAAGLPVINTQNSNEYQNLLEKYNAGINCNNGDIDDISLALEKLIKNKNLRTKLGKGNRKLAEDKFDRNKTYNEIVDIILK